MLPSLTPTPKCGGEHAPNLCVQVHRSVGLWVFKNNSKTLFWLEDVLQVLLQSTQSPFSGQRAFLCLRGVPFLLVHCVALPTCWATLARQDALSPGVMLPIPDLGYL